MENNVIILVIAGTVSLMMMAFAVVFFVLLYKRKVLENELEVKAIEAKHQREMLTATLKSQEDERGRLGKELHDSVGAMLSSIKLNLQLSKQRGSTDTIPKILEYLDETISQVRDISHQMMPILLKKYGLRKAIEDLFKKISTEEFHAELNSWVDFDTSDYNNLMLFRIVQELTNNTLKHAKASKLSLRSEMLEDTIVIHFQDNGIGFPQKVLDDSRGLGLLNIVNRAQSLDAKVEFTNLSSAGACVILVLGKVGTILEAVSDQPAKE